MTHTLITKILNIPTLFVIDDFQNKKRMKKKIDNSVWLKSKTRYISVLKTPKTWIKDKIFVFSCTPHWSSESVIPQGAFDKVLRERGEFAPQVSDNLFRLRLNHTDKMKFLSVWWRIEILVKDKNHTFQYIYKGQRRWAVMVRVFGTLNQSMSNTN